MIGWIMNEIRLLVYLLCLFITSNSSVYAMTMIEQEATTRTDTTENEDASSKKKGIKNSNSSKTLYEEPTGLGKAKNKNKSTQSKWKLKSILKFKEKSNSDKNFSSKPSKKKEKVIPKEDLSKSVNLSKPDTGSSMTKAYSDDKKSAFIEENDSSDITKIKSKNVRRSDGAEKVWIKRNKRLGNLEFPINLSSFKWYRRIVPVRNKSKTYISNFPKEYENTYFGDGYSNFPEEYGNVYFDDNYSSSYGSGVYGDEYQNNYGYSNFPEEYGNVYFDDNYSSNYGSGVYGDEYQNDYRLGIYGTQSEIGGERNILSQNNRGYLANRTKFSSSTRQSKRKQEDIKFNLNLFSLGEKLNDKEEDDEDVDDSENEMMSTPNTQLIPNPNLATMQNQLMNQPLPTQSFTVQQPNPPVIQNSVMTPMTNPEVIPNLNENENLNNQATMQQIPLQNQVPIIQYMAASPMNVQNTTTNRSNPSFMEIFLQNLSGQNDNDQNSNQHTNQQLNRNIYNPNINQLSRNSSPSGDILNNRNNTRNMSDDEVAEETIRYLRDLGVIDESKFVELNMDDIGTCISCRKQKIVTMLDKGKRMGLCKTCAKRLVSDAQSGKFLGGKYSSNENGYGRDGGSDLSEDMVRGGLDRRKEDSVLGSLGKALSGGNSNGIVGTLASAALSAMSNKDSSSNSNEQTGQNAFGTGTLMPISGGGMASERMVLNSAGQLVPLSSLAGSGAPYGYVVDPQTGALIPAKTLEEGLMASQRVIAQQTANQANTIGNGMSPAANQANTIGSGMSPAANQANTIGSGMSPEQIQLMNSGINNFAPGTTLGQMQNLGASPLTSNISNMGKAGKIAAGVAIGAAALGATAAVVNALKKSKNSGGTTSEQMVLDKNGQLVPLSSLAGSEAPYGYVVDPQTGALIPAKTLEEGLAAGQQVSASEQMVLDKNGQLVPLSSLAGSEAPYGYVVDPQTGALIPAKTLEEGLAAGQQASAENVAANQGTHNETGASNGNSKLKTIGKVAAGVAVGAAALGATVAALKAIKKSRGASQSGMNNGTSTATNNSSETQKNVSSGKYPEAEVKKAKKTSDDLTKKINKAKKKIESIKKDIEKAEKEVQKRKDKLASSKNPEKDKRKLESSQENLERLKESLDTQQKAIDNLQQQQNALKEKYGGEPGGPA